MSDSNSTLFTAERVAADAQIHRNTLYQWLEAELIVPHFEVTGSESSRPVFTAAERQRVIELAQARRQLRETLRLSTTQ